MATLPQWIEARVIQKIATEAEWNAITLVPYKGEFCIVGDNSGKVYNIKVGDGINTFPNLEYMFDSIQQNVGYIAIESNALPTPLDDVAWGMVTGGTYTFGGSDVFTVPDGHWGIANYSSGSWSLVDMGELPQVDTTLLVTKNEIGIVNFLPNENIASIFDFQNTDQFGVGIVNSDGSINTSVTNWKYLLNPLSLPAGTYSTNLMLTELTYLVILNKDGDVVTSYSNKGNGAGDLFWGFSLTADQSIRFCQANYFTPELVLRSNVSVSFPTSQLFLLAKDGVSKMELENAKTDIINSSKPFIEESTVPTDWLININYVGNLADLKDSDGNLYELFFVFMRFKDIDSALPSTIIQIARRNKETGVVGVNNISVSTVITEASNVVDDNGMYVATLKPVADSGLTFNVAIDTTKIPSHLLNTNLSDKIKINTAYFGSIANTSSVQTPKILFLGDSVVEFRNYPSIVGRMLDASGLNAGIGGTRMSVHNQLDYDKLSFFQIAEAIGSGDFTQVNSAIDNLIVRVEPTDPARANRLRTTKNNLNNTDYNNLTAIHIAYGTNDWTGGNPIGDISLSNFDTTTIVGALNQGIESILTTYPLIKLFITTPTHRYVDRNLTQDSDIVPQAGQYLIEICEAIKNAANLNHIPALDAYKLVQFNKYNHEDLFDDGVHPNAKGNEILARTIAGFIDLSKLIQ